MYKIKKRQLSCIQGAAVFFSETVRFTDEDYCDPVFYT